MTLAGPTTPLWLSTTRSKLVAMTKPNLLSGMQPSAGSLHLGNYLGALVNWASMQDDYNAYYCVVDMHAITVFQDPVKLRHQTREAAAGFIAAGIDPTRSILFNQSQVTAHAELGWIFNCIARMGWMSRMTQFKDKAGKNSENVSLGLFAYPSLMAADILAYKATHVPVGEDQKQHLELCRDIAIKFNNDYKVDFFPVVEPVIEGAATRVMSLRDGTAKMSKSDPSDQSRINLTDDADTISKKIRKAKTDMDPLPDHIDGLKDRPEAKNLVKYFPTASKGLLQRSTDSVKAVDGVSVQVRAGQTLGVVGESGCGKSTLARLLMRLLTPTSGTVLLDGADITSLTGRELRAVRAKIQMVFQDPVASLNPRHSVGQIIGTPLKFLKENSASGVREHVQELMALVGLNPEHYNRYPHEFSGGQRQRIGIARALAVGPQVIVADEPVSALDVSIQAQVLNLMEKLQSDLGLSYVFIAHDLSVVRHIADEIIVMYLGKVVESGSPNEVYSAPSHPYTQALLSAIPIADPRAAGTHKRMVLVGDVPSPIDPPSGCRFRTRCPRAQELCTVEEPALIDRGQGHPVACHFPG